MSRADNLILCLAANYSLDKIEPFLASWREHAPAAELAMFAANVDSAFEDAVRRLGVTLLDAGPGLDRPYHPQTARYFMYRDHLRTQESRFDSVLITDVRDVLFQGDPFAVERDAPVWFAAEDQVIGGCPWNTGWLKQAYGETVATDLAGHTISCSGTTIGELEGVTAYLDLLCAEAERHAALGQVTGLDQGFHNYILWKMQPDFVRLDTQDRAVATIGYTPPAAVAVNGDRIEVAGRFSPLLHQWDRHAEVESFVRERYRLAV